MAEMIRIALRAELRTALHILGPGRAAALTDRPIELDPDGYPLIAASSIRGRLRAHLERLLAAYGQPVCAPPAAERMCPHGPARPDGGYCMACRIFGSPWREAGITTSDLLLDPDQRVDSSLLRGERTSVSISRRLGTAQSERLFALETTRPALDGAPLAFQGTLIGRIEPVEAGYLLAAVGLVTHAGGSKARGLGELRLAATSVDWRRANAWVEADAHELIEEALSHAAA